MKTILICAFLFGSVYSVEAQEKKLSIVSHVKSKEIKIKWFPSDFQQLKNLIDFGATLERVEINSNTEPNTVNYTAGLKVVIEPTKFRFSTLGTKDNDLKIKSLLEPFLDNVGIDANDEAKSFAFGLLTLENSFSKQLGEIIGSTYTDLNFDKRKTYAYKITIKDVPVGYHVVDASKNTVYPKIDNFNLILDQKKTVELNWIAAKYSEFGYGYLLEKSIDTPKEGSYLTETPYVAVRTKDEKLDKEDFFRDDSLIEGKTHYYRLIGLSYFGERELFSEWKKIYVPNHIHADLFVDSVYATKNSRVILGIASKNSEKPLNISKITLMQSPNKDKGFKTVQSINYTDSSFKFTISMIGTGDQFYYKLIAESKDNDSISSLPYYFFTLDQEPPSQPTNLKGKIDSLGIVKIEWTASTDKDLQGYRIYRANTKKEDFIERNTSLSLLTSFTDTLRLDNLTPEVYYCVKSVDNNYNNSPFSDTILILKPDTIAPVPALLNKLVISDSIVQINWFSSSSSDVENNFLIRNCEDKTDTLFKWKNNVSKFEDKGLQLGKTYSYLIVSEDKSSNSSRSETRSLFYEKGYRNPMKTVSGISNKVSKSIEIRWTPPKEEIFSFQIFKSENGEPLSLIKTIENPDAKIFVDKEVSIGNTYNYTIKYILKSGIHSLPSEKVTVIY